MLEDDNDLDIGDGTKSDGVKKPRNPATDHRVAWKDLPTEVKLERLRAVVKTQNRLIGECRNLLGFLNTRFKWHAHGVNGKVLLPYSTTEELATTVARLRSQQDSDPDFF